MATKKTPELSPIPVEAVVAQAVASPDPAIQQLIAALVAAIQQTKPIEKKNAINRKKGDPWQPKNGEAKLKLKRKMYQHAIPLDPDMFHNEEIDLLNNLKPGRFMDGWVQVIRRKDKGIDIDYPIKTAAQRLKLVNQFGIRNFRELVARCVEEANNPTKYAISDLD